MQVVGVKELKNKLSQMLHWVKAGEDLVITERGRAIARIIPEGKASSDELRSLADLAARGLVRLPEETRGDEPDLVDIRGRPLSETIREGRR
ncbi:MAG: type II toxin-antitoxin system prevent-host-death family antitoxin [Deltaproteobacteria bacterium]|nr:type II toxin-antitoxin system prevent-host-death family antitoxin [Deltaproteobacteria bacterium]